MTVPPLTTGPLTTPLDRQRLLVLHAVHVGGLVTTADAAARVGVEAGVAAAVLAAARDAGLARETVGRVGGWSLTPEGRAGHLDRLAAELHDHGARPAAERAYAAFLALDEPFKQVCTRWQVRSDGRPNNHTDRAHDTAVVADLGRVHRDALALVAGLAAALPRFRRYAADFEAAWHRVTAGDRRAITARRSRSYHDIWTELHEDLLSTLGRDRRAAARTGPPGGAEPGQRRASR